MMNDVGTGMGFGAGIGMLLGLALVVLAIWALIKYLQAEPPTSAGNVGTSRLH